MALLISRRSVRVGDNLYHRGLDAWGQISKFDPSGSAEFVIKTSQGKRKLLVQNGGTVHGRRQLYWHEPIKLDLPFSDINMLQKIVDVVVEKLHPEAAL